MNPATDLGDVERLLAELAELRAARPAPGSADQT